MLTMSQQSVIQVIRAKLTMSKSVYHQGHEEIKDRFAAACPVTFSTKPRSLSPDLVDDNKPLTGDTQAMNEITREELKDTLSAIEERMDKRIDRMEKDGERRTDDYRKELALRDDQLRREMDLRQESFRIEQAARDAALAERFSGFLVAQGERDRALENISNSRLDRIEKDVSSIKADTKKVGEDVNGIKVTMGKYLGGAIVIGAIASALLGVALRYVFSLAGS